MSVVAHSRPASGWAWTFGVVGVGAVMVLNLAVLPRLLEGPAGEGAATASAGAEQAGDALPVARPEQRDTVGTVVASAPAVTPPRATAGQVAPTEPAVTEDAVVTADAGAVEQAPSEVVAVVAVADAGVEEDTTSPSGEAVGEPVAAVAAAEPTEAEAEPTEAAAEPTEAVAEPTEAAAEPTEAVAEPIAAEVPEPPEVAPESARPSEASTPLEVELRFAMDAYTLTAHHEATLAPVVARLLARSGCVAVVDCHADRFGDEQFNEALTRHRCRSVAAYLEASGVAAGRVKTRAHGERDTPGRDGELDPSARVARVVSVCGAPTPAGAHGDTEEERHGDHPVR